jgi:methylase of polypeptide subunit release factors
VEVIERLVAAAPRALVHGGWLLIEIGPNIAVAAEAIVADAADLVPGPTLRDLAGLPRVLQARVRPA